MNRRAWGAAVVVCLAVLSLIVLGWQVIAQDASTTLWVFAHPDDETLTAAGAMLDEREQGTHLVVLLTSGGATNVIADSAFPDTPEAVAQAREREARAALGIMGMYDVDFADLPDGRLTVEEVERVVRELIDGLDGRVIVRGHSPLDSYGVYGSCGHPDHCAAARALLELHRDGVIDELRLYRIQHYFDGPAEGTCRLLDGRQQAFKQEMRRQYAYRNPGVGRYGIAEASVPGPWEATEVEPECFDTADAVEQVLAAPGNGR